MHYRELCVRCGRTPPDGFHPFCECGGMIVPGLEESYYWRGMAEIALGQPEQAAEDFRTALQRHPGYKPALEGLAQLGLAP